jgi:transposase
VAQSPPVEWRHIGIVSKSTGVSRTTISSGLKKLNNPDLLDSSRIRKKGGGRKKAVEKLPAIEEELQKLIEPALRGEPDSPLMWTSKSLRKLSAELKSKGFNVSHKLVGEILKKKGFSLQTNRKTDQGKGHPECNAQFEYFFLYFAELEGETTGEL